MRFLTVGSVLIAACWVVVCFFNPLLAVVGNVVTLLPFQFFAIRRLNDGKG